MKPPVIIVQLIHIAGPMKGEIQEFSMDLISVGRHPSCTLNFAADMTGISRNHAEFVRDGNKFKLLDHSTNGTFINGKRIQEATLSNGDVIEFSEGGPKVSFLMELREATDAQPEAVPQPVAPVTTNLPEPPPDPEFLPGVSPRISPAPEVVEKPVLAPPPPPQPPQPPVQKPVPRPMEKPQPAEVGGDIAAQRIQMPLMIQFGPMLKSYKELPVILGQDSKCNFVMSHPAVFDQHAQIFFAKGQYWIKDITGQNLIMINNQPIKFQAPMNTDDFVALSPRGPVFKFIGEGRLAEVEDAQPASQPEPQKGPAKAQPKDTKDTDEAKGGFFKRLFNK